MLRSFKRAKCHYNTAKYVPKRTKFAAGALID